MMSEAQNLKPIHFSIIIPCHNESERIETTLRHIESVLHAAHLLSTLDHCILVENGSTDDTYTVLTKCRDLFSRLNIVVIKSEKGKGAAIKAGLESTLSPYALISDADGSTDISYLIPILEKIEMDDFDIVNSSRRIIGAEVISNQTAGRQIAGNFFHSLIKYLFRLPVSDTQNGFKLYKTKSIAPLYASLSTKGWVTEVEVFYLAKKKGLKVAEIPVAWYNDKRSTLSVKDIPSILKDIFKIMIRYRP